MRILYVMDPLETMHPAKDSTYAFLREGQQRGHENLHCLPRQVTVREGKVYAHVRQAFVQTDAPYHRYGTASTVALSDLDAVMIRKDPPFDQAYLYLTLILERARGEVFVANDPRGLREANEKLYATHFSRWMPRTLVSADRDEIHAFVDTVGGRAVIKPLDGAGGAGVLMLRKGDNNARAIVDTLTAEGTRLAMVQAFLPEVTVGDKRVLLLDGQILGAILRVPRADDLRSNIHVGGSVVPTELTPRERELVADISPRLQEDGLFFVGLDLIGEHLTEVNVTSPTGIQELGRFTGSHPEGAVLSWLEKRKLSLRFCAVGDPPPQAEPASFRPREEATLALPAVSVDALLDGWLASCLGGAGGVAAGRAERLRGHAQRRAWRPPLGQIRRWRRRQWRPPGARESRRAEAWKRAKKTGALRRHGRRKALWSRPTRGSQGDHHGKRQPRCEHQGHQQPRTQHQADEGRLDDHRER